MNSSSNLRVLQVGMRWLGEEGYGGLDRMFSQLVLGLHNQGTNVRGLVTGPHNAEEATSGLVSSFVNSNTTGLAQRLIGVRRAVLSELTQRPPDLIASHFALYSLSYLDKTRRLPFVMHFHGPWADESLNESMGQANAVLKRNIERTVYKCADRVIVLSDAFANLLVKEYGLSRERVRVIPGCVDLTHFSVPPTKKFAREQLGWPTDRKIILSVRRLQARMGLGGLLAALKEVVSADPDVLCIIAGKGYLREELEQQVLSANLTKNVNFIGFLPEDKLSLAFGAADLNVVPSISLEGFGLVVLEALASGTPTVVSKVGGMPEILENFSPQLIFTPGDTGELADILISALSGAIPIPDEVACRRHAEHYSVPTFISRTMDLYKELL